MPAAPPRTEDSAAGATGGAVAVGSPDASAAGREDAADGPLRPARVTPVTITEVISRIHETRPGDGPVELRGLDTVVVTGATLRAREVRPGDLFAALAGARAHGADHAADALARGAAAVLTDAAGAERATLREAALEA
ncbi:MAG TPA: Mur ligase domain-containing protein, partial [Actinomycetospora sp.]|nr:Mur ligase domain-containing protein [Actinomycetospora sp.]